jgi:hypothetical protein
MVKRADPHDQDGGSTKGNGKNYSFMMLKTRQRNRTLSEMRRKISEIRWDVKV